MYIPGSSNPGTTDIWGWRTLCHRRLLCTVGCLAASVANSIPSLSFENQKSPDIVKCLLGDEIIQPRSTGLCEGRPYLQIPIILKFNASDCGFYPCAVAVSTYYHSLENKKQHRKPAHHKIISRIGLQSRAFVLISLKRNLHMKIFSSKDSIHYHIPCLQAYLQIPIWKDIKGQTTIFLQTHCGFWNYCITKTDGMKK